MESLSLEPATEAEVIPSPKLFLNVVQRQWASPGAEPNTSNMDKGFYNMGPDLTKALQVPVVDAPVAALATPSVLVGESEDALRAEDESRAVTKKDPSGRCLGCQSIHGCFPFLIGLPCSGCGNCRRGFRLGTQSHQDINKVMTAMEFSVDAMLNTVRFASRAITSSVATCQLLWLRQWQVDAKHKWRLASAPFTGDRLFGDALDPILVESRDKWKMLPSVVT